MNSFMHWIFIKHLFCIGSITSSYKNYTSLSKSWFDEILDLILDLEDWQYY